MKHLEKYCAKHGLDLEGIVAAHAKPVGDSKSQKVPDDEESEHVPDADNGVKFEGKAKKAAKKMEKK